MGEPLVEPNDGNEPDPGFDPDQDQPKIDAVASAYAFLDELEALADQAQADPTGEGKAERLARLRTMIGQAREFLTPFLPEDQVMVARGQAASRLDAFGSETDPEG